MQEDTRIICCGIEIKYNYCPICGKPKGKIVRDTRPLYPLRFTTYANGEKNALDKDEVMKYLGLPADHPLTKNVLHCDDRIKLEWDIDKNRNVRLVAVNNRLLEE